MYHRSAHFHAGSGDDRLTLADALIHQLAGELGNQDAVFADQAHQGHKADPCVDVDRRMAKAKTDEEQGPAAAIGTDIRMVIVAEASNWAQHEEGDDKREQEDAKKAALFWTYWRDCPA